MTKHYGHGQKTDPEEGLKTMHPSGIKYSYDAPLG